MAVGVATEYRDGDRVQAPGDVWLPCNRCGSKLRFLTWYHGEPLCRSCLSIEVLRGRRRR